jgi:hypothetical protein
VSNTLSGGGGVGVGGSSCYCDVKLPSAFFGSRLRHGEVQGFGIESKRAPLDRVPKSLYVSFLCSFRHLALSWWSWGRIAESIRKLRPVNPESAIAHARVSDSCFSFSLSESDGRERAELCFGGKLVPEEEEIDKF